MQSRAYGVYHYDILDIISPIALKNQNYNGHIDLNNYESICGSNMNAQDCIPNEFKLLDLHQHAYIMSSI